MALMKGAHLQEIGGRSRGGGATFVAPRHGRCVIGEVTCGEVRDRDRRCKDVVVGHSTRQFEIAIRYGPVHTVGFY